MRTHRLKLGVFFAAVMSAITFLALPASAMQSPSACNSNRLNLSVIKDRTSVQQGDTINYTVTLTNVDSAPAIACDITDATVSLTLPASDGTPTGTVVILATSASYPAGTAQTTVGTASYVVNVSAGVTDVVAEAKVNGTLHDAPIDHSAEIIKTIGTAVTTPTAPVTPTPSGSTSSAPKLPNAGAPLGLQ